MKKLIVVSLVLALCAGAALAAGCNDDSAQAKKYMESADELSGQMRLLTNETVFDAAGLLTELGVEMSETGTVKKQTLTEAANEQLDKVIANGEKAKDEYQKILDLKGAEPYKEYARARITAIESTVRLLEPIQGLLDEIGSSNNTASIGSTVTQWAKSHVGLAADAVKAFTSWRNADNIKKKNNLGPVEEPSKGSAPATTP